MTKAELNQPYITHLMKSASLWIKTNRKRYWTDYQYYTQNKINKKWKHEPK